MREGFHQNYNVCEFDSSSFILVAFLGQFKKVSQYTAVLETIIVQDSKAARPWDFVHTR